MRSRQQLPLPHIARARRSATPLWPPASSPASSSISGFARRRWRDHMNPPKGGHHIFQWCPPSAGWTYTAPVHTGGPAVNTLHRFAVALTAAICLATALLPAQQATLTPAEMQRRRDLEAELQQIAHV